MISFRRCSQRTPPSRSFEHLTLCSSKGAATAPCGTQNETGEETAAE